MVNELANTRDIAMAAKAQITTHELICAQRWVESKAALEELKETFRQMQSYGMKAVAWILVALASSLTATIWWIVTHPAVAP